ncbi:cell division protein FtsQ/DivIB [Rheinheimera sp. UJ51]|uniref:cell division protein FtsQ/DivIB n=1 Tax=Rheinheimera sp. UJ51 TaxID=2892446 RepID=UPI001E5E2310|nr:cell division protein FtsQ/DivIB [Rheinheimera sp. UJ51]MCC5450759.1 cell division protein FtsQ/DivIB [Rheinheimera sp. UJ51]
MTNTATEPATPSRAAFIAGLVFFGCSLVFLGYLTVKLVQWVQDQQSVPISQVKLYGNFQHLDAKALQQRIQQEYVGNFFRVNVDQVQQFLQQQHWVYQVAVRKQWPDTLVVVVTEQQPVAVWNSEQLINNKGVVFDAPLEQLTTSLPLLHGPAGSAQDALNMFTNMQQLLQLHEFSVRQIWLTERFAWRLELADGLQLQLGREESLKRLQRFVELYPTMQQHKINAAMVEVDLRYDTGIAVRYGATETKRKT